MSVSALLTESIVSARSQLRSLVGEMPATPSYLTVDVVPIGRVARPPTPPLGSASAAPIVPVNLSEKVRTIYGDRTELLLQPEVMGVPSSSPPLPRGGVVPPIDPVGSRVTTKKVRASHRDRKEKILRSEAMDVDGNGDVDEDEAADEAADDDDAIRREFSDFLVDDEDIKNEEARALEMLMGGGYGDAPIVGRSAKRQHDEVGEFFVEASDDDDDDDDDDDVAQSSGVPADPLTTLLEIEAVDAATHGKRLAGDVFVDDRRRKRVYSKALCVGQDPSQPTDVSIALGLVDDVLRGHVAAAAAADEEFAMLSHHLLGAMAWRVEPSAAPSLCHVIISYGDRATLDGLPREHTIELVAAMAEPALLSKVWRSVNWHAWVRSMFYLQEDVWTADNTMHDAVAALIDDDNVIYQRLYESYGDCVEFLVGMLTAA